MNTFELRVYEETPRSTLIRLHTHSNVTRSDGMNLYNRYVQIYPKKKLCYILFRYEDIAP